MHARQLASGTQPVVPCCLNNAAVLPTYCMAAVYSLYMREQENLLYGNSAVKNFTGYQVSCNM